jgi:hypothetical protein
MWGNSEGGKSTENIFPISTGNLESRTAEMSFSCHEPMSTEGKRTRKSPPDSRIGDGGGGGDGKWRAKNQGKPEARGGEKERARGSLSRRSLY